MALQFFIEKINIVFIVIGNLGIRYGNGLCALKAQLFNFFDNSVLAANQDGVAIPGVAESESRADHPFLFTLGKDDTLAVGGNSVIDDL